MTKTMRVPVEAQLHRRWAGQAVGYRILDLQQIVVASWTSDQVIERAPGHFVVVGGVEAPAAGGHIVWGLADQDIASAPIEPAAPDPTTAILAGIGEMIDRAVADLRQSIAETQQSMTEAERDTQQRQRASHTQTLTTLAGVLRQLQGMRTVIDDNQALTARDRERRRKQQESLLIIDEFIESIGREN